MKELKLVFLVIFSLALSICKVGITKNVVIDYGYSNKFSEEEIKSAISAVLYEFKNFNGCDLKRLWYNEAISNEEIDNYMLYGHGSQNNLKQGNVIILLSDFYVNSTCGDGSLKPNSMYTDWKWVLIRTHNTNKWKIDDWGY
jgi:hypothetical protein